MMSDIPTMPLPHFRAIMEACLWHLDPDQQHRLRSLGPGTYRVGEFGWRDNQCPWSAAGLFRDGDAGWGFVERFDRAVRCYFGSGNRPNFGIRSFKVVR